ncbi:MAG: hypothetical protein JW915_05105 [Chitinispirillaceae bacterium]|nr:hypothetical protein [Chitinispirillaceae bacterium]
MLCHRSNKFQRLINSEIPSITSNQLIISCFGKRDVVGDDARYKILPSSVRLIILGSENGHRAMYSTNRCPSSGIAMHHIAALSLASMRTELSTLLSNAKSRLELWEIRSVSMFAVRETDYS